jgi:hypothetical protein
MRCVNKFPDIFIVTEGSRGKRLVPFVGLRNPPKPDVVTQSPQERAESSPRVETADEKQNAPQGQINSAVSPNIPPPPIDDLLRMDKDFLISQLQMAPRSSTYLESRKLSLDRIREIISKWPELHIQVNPCESGVDPRLGICMISLERPEMQQVSELGPAQKLPNTVAEPVTYYPKAMWEQMKWRPPSPYMSARRRARDTGPHRERRPLPSTPVQP